MPIPLLDTLDVGASVRIKGPNPWLDVTASPFNAVGNGSADDTAAVAAALAACPDGGTVFFPLGTFDISQVTLPASKRIRIVGAGPGSILRHRSGATGHMVISGGTAPTSVTFENLTIDGNFSGMTGNFSTLLFTVGEGAAFRHVRFKAWRRHALNLTGATTTVVVKDCEFADGAEWDGTAGRDQTPLVFNNGNTAIYHAIVSGCFFKHGTPSVAGDQPGGINVDSQSGNQPIQATIVGNTFRKMGQRSSGTTVGNIYFYRAGHGSRIERNRFEDPYFTCVAVENSSDVMVARNTIKATSNLSGYGISIQGLERSNNVQQSGNAIVRNTIVADALDAGSAEAIYVDMSSTTPTYRVQDTMIAGNRIRGFRSALRATAFTGALAFEDNVVRDIIQGGSNGHAIWINSGLSGEAAPGNARISIARNKLYSVYANAIHFDDVALTAVIVQVIGNHFEDTGNANSGLTIRGVASVEIASNTWKGTPTSGAIITLGSATNAVTVADVHDNRADALSTVTQTNVGTYRAYGNSWQPVPLTSITSADVTTALGYTPVTPTLVDAKGDLLVGTADNTLGRLAAGNERGFLKRASSATTGLVWADDPVFNVKDPVYGAKGDGTTDDTAAIQAAIDAAVGGSVAGGASATRYALGPLFFPPGTYRISGPLKVYSAVGFHLIGSGISQTRFAVSGARTVGLDLNGVGYSTFRDFSITCLDGGAGSDTVDDALYLYWDNTTAQFPTTMVRFYDVAVHDAKFKRGIKVGKDSNTLQEDQTFWYGCQVIGNWAAGDTTWWQAGVMLGTGVSANNLSHNVFGITAQHCRRNVHIRQTQALIQGGCVQTGEVDFYLEGATTYIKIVGIRSEHSGRLLESYGAADYSAMVSIEDVDWNVTSALNADTFAIYWTYSGTLRLKNIRFGSGTGATTHARVLASAGGAYNQTVDIEGMTFQGPTTTPTLANIFNFSAVTNTRIVGLRLLDSSGLTATTVDGPIITGPGKLNFGANNAAPDVNLYRQAVDVLATDDSFRAAGYMEVAEQAAPATPGSGYGRIYPKSDHKLYFKNSAGTEVDLTLGGAGGSVATDAIWDAKGDLAVGTGADTAAKLTVGANGTRPVADSAQTTGINWTALTSGEVTAALGYTPSNPAGPYPVIDVHSPPYNAPTNGTSDASTAIQAAIDAAPATGAIIRLRPIVYAIATGLTILDKPNVRLQGAGAYHAMYGGIPTVGTVLKWTGSAGGGPVLTVGATSGGGLTSSVPGVAVTGMTIAAYGGTNSATTALKIQSCWWGEFSDLHLRNGTTVTLDVTTINLSGVDDTQGCVFEKISIVCTQTTTCKGIRWSSWSDGGGNISLNEWRDIGIYHHSGTAFEAGDSDSNRVIGLWTNRASGGTGIGLELRGSNTAFAGYCRDNSFYYVQCSGGGVAARATGLVSPAINNTITDYSLGNSSPYPIIESGAELWIHTTTGVSGINGQWFKIRNWQNDADLNVFRLGNYNYLEVAQTIFRDDLGEFNLSYTGAFQVYKRVSTSATPSTNTREVMATRHYLSGATTLTTPYQVLDSQVWDYLDTQPFTITAMTAASPIVVTTSAAHGLTTGDTVVIFTVSGLTGGTGVFRITVTDTTHFSLDGSTGVGTFTSSGGYYLSRVRDQTITGATNATPIVITTASPHRWATGEKVRIYGVVGNTAANNTNATTWTITVLSATTFSLNSSVGNGAYTSGGIVTNRAAGTVYSATVVPVMARGGVSGADDMDCYVGYNSGLAKATDCYYIGRNAMNFPGAASEWTTGFTIDGNVDYGFNINGAVATAVMRFPNDRPFQGLNAAASAYVNLWRINTLNELQIDAPSRFNSSWVIGNGANMTFGTSTGTKFGVATNNMIGFWNATPIVQPALTSETRAALVSAGLIASGGATNTGNATPVTASNPSAAANLMSYTVPAGSINVAAKTLRVTGSGVYTTAASQTPTITIAVKLGSVTIATWTTAATTASQTNLPWNFDITITTVTTGASGTVEVHGNLNYRLGTGAGTLSILADTNTAASSAIDLTASQTLQVTALMSSSNASNSVVQRQMLVAAAA